ncbi:MAG TPA: hypothetical protein V6D08_05365 [Candidatus Obscuribacterales bacterium]
MEKESFQAQPERAPAPEQQQSSDPFTEFRQFALLGKPERQAPPEQAAVLERSAYSSTSSSYAAIVELGRPQGMAALCQRLLELESGSTLPPSAYDFAAQALTAARQAHAYEQPPSPGAQANRDGVADWALAPPWSSRREDFSPPRVTDAPAWPARRTERAEVLELRLRHRSAAHDKPDAVVLIPAGFDPSRPVNVVVYNHGHNTYTSQALKNSDLAQQMESAPPNTILVIPEWQAHPGTATSKMGAASQPGFFRGMFQEIFDVTPALRGLRVDDVAGISIVSHSAGYNPTIAQVYRNGFGDKVKSITMLDSLYNGTAFDKWIQDNIYDLAAGRKHFENFYSGTAEQSLSLARRIDTMLQQAGLPRSAMVVEDRNGQDVMDSSTIANHGIVFKRSTRSVRGRGAHSSVANIYLGQIMDARRQSVA